MQMFLPRNVLKKALNGDWWQDVWVMEAFTEGPRIPSIAVVMFWEVARVLYGNWALEFSGKTTGPGTIGQKCSAVLWACIFLSIIRGLSQMCSPWCWALGRMVITHSLHSLVHREIWTSWRKEHKWLFEKQGSWPPLPPWRVQNPEVFLHFFH